jgi:hypothetical protein
MKNIANVKVSISIPISVAQKQARMRGRNTRIARPRRDTPLVRRTLGVTRKLSVMRIGLSTR